MLKLTCRTLESNFHDLYVLSHAVSEPFACDVKLATMEQHFLMTSSTEYRKYRKMGLQQHKNVNLSHSTAT